MIDVWILNDSPKYGRSSKVKLINIFWHPVMQCEVGAVTQYGDIWFVRTELLEVIEEV